MHEQIRDILLQHRGKFNAITSKEISRMMGFPMEDTQSKSRKTIRETIEMFGLPVISCNKGYYIAETDEEMEEYNSNIQRRIDGMQYNRERANEFYKEHIK